MSESASPTLPTQILPCYRYILAPTCTSQVLYTYMYSVKFKFLHTYAVYVHDTLHTVICVCGSLSGGAEGSSANTGGPGEARQCV